MRPARKRTLSRALQEAQETEAAKAAPPPKRPATTINKKFSSVGYPTGLPPRPHRCESETFSAHPPVDAGIAESEWKALMVILAESARHAKGSEPRSMCLENLYADLRKIYTSREQSSCDEAAEQAPASEEPAASHVGDEFLKGGEQAAAAGPVEAAAEGIDGGKVEEEDRADEASTTSAEEGRTTSAEEGCTTPPAAEESLSTADTPKQQSPVRQADVPAACLEAAEEEAPRAMRTRNAKKAR
mmetsp:Transcript_2772/g.5513  ORF Transcript_2772/g.5513 Transcript_2772/m.5513 type:complete len:244 (-) Transcript_2772:157-888(-)|eukprot:CAMPEP_0173387734 /NCGR_PEP_ID=MMETSP1356-20130122/10187_1 /TAXON_ID=77927 ORGANISM="Hemiselmis virescens, Strain PCC157" /NCGR_SAMPLE_ID=MMETSP1356 /ASSEMBLY_ACC=CAM_ASM_000847 /LENGTH=243 /DNA_ID=CAMNT_0014344435 /DNA_START=168 /DNA_END=899 /DNA_ORIENTATION=+